MNQDKFITRMQELAEECVKTARAKNTDYANASDAFANFRACEMYGVSAPQGIIVRMSDKMTRAANLLTRRAEVKDESVKDTLSDLAVYALILRILLESSESGDNF